MGNCTKTRGMINEAPRGTKLKKLIEEEQALIKHENKLGFGKNTCEKAFLTIRGLAAPPFLLEK